MCVSKVFFRGPTSKETLFKIPTTRLSMDKKTNPTLRAALSPAALKKMEALRQAGSLTDQEKKERREQRASRQKFKHTLVWLEETFPNCFNQADPKPLKLKIEFDLFEAIEGNEEFSRLNMRKALAFYTSRLAYQESFLTASHRVDLEGNECEAIEDKHREYATKRIQEIKDKING